MKKDKLKSSILSGSSDRLGKILNLTGVIISTSTETVVITSTGKSILELIVDHHASGDPNNFYVDLEETDFVKSILNKTFEITDLGMDLRIIEKGGRGGKRISVYLEPMYIKQTKPLMK